MEERHIVCPYCGCINEINELIGRRYVCKNCGGVLRGYPQNNYISMKSNQMLVNI